MDKCSKVAALYVATLKAMTLIHQHSHWTTGGRIFYGDHLLFMRIYESAQENLDQAAEKFIGLQFEGVMDYDYQNELLSKVLSKYSKLDGSPLEMSLAIEKEFVAFSKGAYECFEAEGKMTLGLDDMIMAIANKREESIYLLQQTLKGQS